MNQDTKRFVCSVVGVCGVAAGWYALRNRRSGERELGRATFRATVVGEPPQDAAVVSETVLNALPGAKKAAGRAARSNVSEKWVTVTAETPDALACIDLLQEELPYYGSEGGPEAQRSHSAGSAQPTGVYVRCGEQTVAVDGFAVGPRAPLAK